MGLETFLAGPRARDLSDAHRALLKQQGAHMIAYADILAKRLITP